MSYEPLDFEDLRDEALDEYRNQVAGAKVSADTEIYARASVLAGVGASISYGLLYVERQIFPDTADSDNLTRHAGLYGLTRKDATAATGGQVLLVGVNGTVVSAGLTLSAEDGTAFVTTSGGTVADGELAVDVDATTTGTAGNKVVGDPLTVDSPPSGVSATTEVSVALGGGTDTESDAELLARVLARMRAGSAGGTKADYEAWALSIPGVVAAHCLPLRLGLGCVSVAVFSEDVDGNREPAGADLRATVLEYLDSVRPITADVDVPEVTETYFGITYQITEIEDGYDEDTVLAEVEANLRVFLYSLKTGETAHLTRLDSVVSKTGGVLDFTRSLPDENKTPTVSTSTVEILIPPETITIHGPDWVPPT